MKLVNQTVLITGGTSGIGFELAKQLLKLGNTVVVTGRDPERLARSKSLLPGLLGLVSDVSDPGAIESLYKKVIQDFPTLNILINNAGIMRTINLQESNDSLKQLTQEIETNLSGPIRMTSQFLSHLKKQKSAAIMNVSSGLAFVPLPISPVYCATKAGLHSYSLSLRVQLKNTQVKVFELAPPATRTELLGHMNEEDMKGIQAMEVDAMVTAAIRGLQSDQYEIRPGQSNQLKMMNRIAPNFILKMLSKPVERMHSEMKT